MTKERFRMLPLRMSGRVPRSEGEERDMESITFTLPAEWQVIRSGFEEGKLGIRSHLFKDEDGERLGLDDLLPDENVDVENEAIENIEGRYDLDRLEASVQKLTDRERLIIELRFGLTGAPQSLRTIGDQIGISGERVRAIESAAIRRLRRDFRGSSVFNYR